MGLCFRFALILGWVGFVGCFGLDVLVEWFCGLWFCCWVGWVRLDGLGLVGFVV